jgi:hypothetical protein
MPDNITQGGGMGLTEDDQQLNSTNNHFVAVEFDFFSDHSSNARDPPGEHVGIDINSMLSVANVSWRGSWISIMVGSRDGGGGDRLGPWSPPIPGSKNFLV